MLKTNSSQQLILFVVLYVKLDSKRPEFKHSLLIVETEVD